MDMNLSEFWEIMEDSMLGILQSTGSQRVRHNLLTEQISRVENEKTDQIFKVFRYQRQWDSC